MGSNRQTAVLFADITGSTKLYEAGGDDSASEAIARCLACLCQAATSSGGRVMKTIGDGVMALYSTPDAAASAASEMQGAMDCLPAVGSTKLGLRIGFHFGPVIHHEGDVFGDTVNLASRLVEQAVKGQILTSERTAQLLGPIFRAWTRPLYSIQIKGKAAEVGLTEIVSPGDRDMTTFAAARPKTPHASAALRPKYGDQEILGRRLNEMVTIGRDDECTLVIADKMVSRQHCTIERRQDKLVLKDHSANGTYGYHRW